MRLYLTFYNLEDRIAVDKVQETIDSYVYVRRGDLQNFIPARRGVVRRFLADGYEAWLVLRTKKRGVLTKAQAQPQPGGSLFPKAVSQETPHNDPDDRYMILGSRHKAMIAEAYYAEMCNQPLQKAVNHALERGGYDEREIARCIIDGAKAAKIRKEFVSSQIAYDGPEGKTLSVMSAYAKTGYCWASQSRIASALGLRRETVNRHIKALKAACAIIDVGYGIVRKGLLRVVGGTYRKWEFRVRMYQITEPFLFLSFSNTNANISPITIANGLKNRHGLKSLGDTSVIEGPGPAFSAAGSPRLSGLAIRLYDE